MKVTILLQSRRFFKYYYGAGCFKDLEKNHEVIYAVLKSDKDSIDELKKQKKTVLEIHYSPSKKLYRLFEIYSNLSLKRHANRSRSFSLKFGNFYRAWSRKGQFFHLVLSLPVLFEFFSFLFKKMLIGNPLVSEKAFKSKPDCLIAPSGGTMDIFSMLAFKAAHSLEIKSVMLMFNWDNITCKGVYPFFPKLALLWGNQSKRHYIKINKVSEKDVFVIGSAQFGSYEEQSSFKKLDLRSHLNLGENKVLGCYLGGARYRSDIELLKKLDPILSERDLALIYRPHPWQDNDMLEENFFTESFSSIFMDPAMAVHYQNSRRAAKYDMKAFIPELSYFPAFLSEMDFSISSYSTMALESIKMGKPVILTGFKDQKFSYSFDKLRKYEHHDEWKNIKYVFECLNENELSSSIEKVKNWALDDDISEKLIESSKEISYFDERSYSSRLVDIIEKAFSPKEELL